MTGPARREHDPVMTGRLALLLWLALLMPMPCVAAEDWQRFIDPRSGVGIDLPPGFIAHPSGETEGTGRLFTARDGLVLLRLAGRALGPDDFGNTAAALIAQDQAQGWAITFRSLAADWAAWRGTRGGVTLVVRLERACQGRQMASVRLSFPAVTQADHDVTAERVMRSLAQDGGCF